LIRRSSLISPVPSRLGCWHCKDTTSGSGILSSMTSSAVTTRSCGGTAALAPSACGDAVEQRGLARRGAPAGLGIGHQRAPLRQLSRPALSRREHARDGRCPVGIVSPRGRRARFIDQVTRGERDAKGLVARGGGLSILANITRPTPPSEPRARLRALIGGGAVVGKFESRISAEEGVGSSVWNHTPAVPRVRPRSGRCLRRAVAHGGFAGGRRCGP
jgi:hypothetical protein